MTSFFGHKTKSKSALCSGCGALYIFFNGFYITRNKSPKTFQSWRESKKRLFVCHKTKSRTSVRKLGSSRKCSWRTQKQNPWACTCCTARRRAQLNLKKLTKFIALRRKERGQNYESALIWWQKKRHGMRRNRPDVQKTSMMSRKQSKKGGNAKLPGLFWEWAKSTVEEVTSCLDTAKANEDMRTHRLCSLVRVIYVHRLPSMMMMMMTMPWGWLLHEPRAPT